MYGDVVMGVQKRPEEDHEPFETVIHDLKHERYHEDIDDPKLTVDDLKELGRPLQGADQSTYRQGLSRRIPGSSSMVRSALFSDPG